MNFPFPVLVCDVGGTNARFGLVAAPDSALQIWPHLRTHDFPSFEATLAQLLPLLPMRPLSVIACVAGPVGERSVQMTNAKWFIDGPEVAARTGLLQGLLLNDFEAQALALPALQPSWTMPIGPALPAPSGAQLILGLGTGLGVAALLQIEGRYFALATEAGHMEFGPVGAEETAIWAHLANDGRGRISAEALLSGPGLMRLHRARCAAKGTVAPEFSEIALIAEAVAQPESEAGRTMRLLWRLTARFAGDLTLAFLARGGVTLAGGILPRLTGFLDPQDFRASFEDKFPYGDLMRTIGTRLIIADDVVLGGMAAIAAAPQNYIIDYERRAWT